MGKQTKVYTYNYLQDKQTNAQIYALTDKHSERLNLKIQSNGKTITNMYIQIVRQT